MRPRKPWYRSDRNWWMTEVNGRQVKLCRGRENRHEAEQKFHALMAEVLANPPIDGGNPTVGSVIEAFLEHAIRYDATYTHYERKIYLQKFADVHGGRLVAACLPYHLTSWVDSHPTWRAEATRSYAIRCIKRPFNWAVREGLIDQNPFARVPHHPGGHRRPMTDAEFAKLLNAAGPTSRFGEILRFLAGTGCRPCEVRMLRWNEMHFDRSLIIFRQHKTARMQRTYQPRLVPLVPEVAELLSAIRERKEHEEFVFVTHRRRPWARSSIQQCLRRWRRTLGLPADVLLYGIRHKFGTDSIRHGNDVKTTSLLLGHQSTRVTERYLHLADQYDHLAAAMRRATTSA